VFEVAGAPVTAAIGDPQRVRLTLAHSPAGTVTVPVSAIWTGPDGRTVVTVVEGGGQRAVTVDVRLTVNGRVAVIPLDGALPAGAQVVVAYRDGGTGQ
jgi:hypothetical protein